MRQSCHLASEKSRRAHQTALGGAKLFPYARVLQFSACVSVLGVSRRGNVQVAPVFLIDSCGADSMTSVGTVASFVERVWRALSGGQAARAFRLFAFHSFSFHIPLSLAAAAALQERHVRPPVSRGADVEGGGAFGGSKKLNLIIGSHLRGNIFKDEPWLGTEVLNIKRKVPGNFPLFIIFFNE